MGHCPSKGEGEEVGGGRESRAATLLSLRCYEVVIHLNQILVLPLWEKSALEENLIPMTVTRGCRGTHKGGPSKLSPGQSAVLKERCKLTWNVMKANSPSLISQSYS